MDTPELRERVDAIEAVAADPEMAHGEEDKLLREWVMANARFSQRREFERLFALDFPRWTA